MVYLILIFLYKKENLVIMSGKLTKSKLEKKVKVKKPMSVKNVDKKNTSKIKLDFLDVLNGDVWDFMNDFDQSELK